MSNTSAIKFSKYSILIFAITIIISIALSLISSNRSDVNKYRNDTPVYSEHFSCLVENGKDCSSILGGLDYGYGIVANLLEKVSFHSFFIFKFLVTFVISFPILYFVLSKSISPLFSLIFLLSDYRFYEYFSNVLRHGLALSFFCILMLFFSRHNWKYLLSFIIVPLTHLSTSVLLLIPFTKVRGYFILGVLATSIFGVMFFVPLGEYFNSYLPSKIQYYINNSEGFKFSSPIQYTVMFFLTLALYKKFHHSKIAFANAIIVLFLTSVFFNSIGMGYRFISFSLPFYAILFPSMVSIISKSFGVFSKQVYITSSLIFSILLMLLFIRNYAFIYLHLS
ncbi:EpsG family protein [Vibrio sp. SBT000027]|uniref:EpsG family protein n=1 Tax=Vibrio sp. SBT000027 TaxID=1803384 RepID=UPI000EF5098D|nr:EpsG family protein [Vibrio sp. SBT000027]RLQ15565.1 EpsG family protein [Vibrio sp. SBT000027]